MSDAVTAAPAAAPVGGAWSCAVVGANPLTAQCAQLLLDRGHRIEALVTDDAVLTAWAEERGLPRVGHGPGLAEELRRTPVDYLFSIVNLRILPQDVLDLPRRAAVNYHDGPLPRHAGVHATSWALCEQAGEAGEHGVTWHLMTAEADTGDLLVQRAVPVEPDETAYSLNVKCFEAALESFTELVEGLEHGTVRPRPQDLAGRSYHGMTEAQPDGGVLVWTRPALRLRALVRAADFGPHPNAWGAARLLGPEGVVLATAAEVQPGGGAAPGTVVGLDDTGLAVATGDGTLRLTGLCDVDGEPLSAAQLAARWNLETGARLPIPEDGELAAFAAAGGEARRHEAFWARRLGRPIPLELPYRDPVSAEPDGVRELTVPVPAALAGDGSAVQGALAAALAFLARVSGGSAFDLALAVESAGSGSALDLWAVRLPLRVPSLEQAAFPEYRAAVAAELASVQRRGPHLRDLRARRPELRRASADTALPIGLVLGEGPKSDEDTEPGQIAWLHVAVDGSCVTWLLDRRSFSAEAAAGLAADFTAFMSALISMPVSPVVEMPLLIGERRRLVRYGWNETEAEPVSACVTEQIARQAVLRPEAVAVADADCTLTYRELTVRVGRIAQALGARGVGPGSRVGVLMRRRADLVAVLLGVLASGAAYVPLDPVYPLRRLEYMVCDAGLALLVADPETADGAAGQTPVCTPGSLDEDADATQVTDADDRASLDAPAYVIYTSGSTGNPKGVQVGHRALSNLLASMAQQPGCGPQDVLLAVTTVCFDIAGLELYLPLTVGGRVVVAAQEAVSDGFALRALVEHTAPTVMQATPAGWRSLLAAGWEGDARLRALCGGEALPADLAARLDGCVGEVWNLYGPTETTIWSAVSRVRAEERITIGRPIANTRFHVLDPCGEPVPPYVPGELYIAGDGVADGYLERPELTAQRFVPDPMRPGTMMYRTGDIVRYLAGGELEYLHRADNQIKLRGFRIELGEIETVLARHPSVGRCVAVVRQDPGAEAKIVAYVVAAPVAAASRGAGSVDAEVLRRHAEADLPHYMVPAAFVRLDRIPLTDNGKVDRKALPAPAAAAVAGRGPVPDSGIERVIATAWRSVLASDGFGLDDNFFDVGGSSLTVVGMVARLRAETGRPVTVVDVFRCPTIRTLAARLDGSGAAGTAGPAAPARTGPNRAALLRRSAARSGS